MDLSIISWNVNFIHDNWSNRLIKINKRLEQEQKTTDIICIKNYKNIFLDIKILLFFVLKK